MHCSHVAHKPTGVVRLCAPPFESLLLAIKPIIHSIESMGTIPQQNSSLLLSSRMSGLAHAAYYICAVSFRISLYTHCVVPPRADDVRQVGARVEEEVVAPLLVTDVEGVAVDIYSENETDDTSFEKTK